MLEWLGDWADGLWNWVVIVVFLALAAWESLVPARSASTGAIARWLTNLSLYAFNSSLLLVFVPAALAGLVSSWFGLNHRPFDVLAPAVGDVGVIVAGILALDLFAYGMHRVEHNIFFLWRFHAVHHADIDMDASTTVRHHPIETLISSLIGAVIFVILGIPEWVFPIYALIGITISLIQHANAHLPARLDRALRWVLVTPDMHRIHHSIAVEDYEANYGTVLSIWDRLLGTYRDQPVAGRAGLAFGVEPFTEKRYARIHWAWLLPFAIRRPAADAKAESLTVAAQRSP